jgi:DDE superfamily endonuclease
MVASSSSTMVASSSSSSSSSGSKQPYRAAAGNRNTNRVVRDEWKAYIADTLKKLPLMNSEEVEEFETLWSLHVIVNELDPDGPGMQMFRALETADRRREWGKRRVKSTHHRKFSEVIGRHFSSPSASGEAGFRRYFRMSKESFFKLCETICSNVGTDVFRPESSIDGDHQAAKGAVKGGGGAICGEVRLAVCIRLLAGASYLDLMVIFDLCHRSIFRCFHTAIGWITSSLTFPLPVALRDQDEAFFEKRAEAFANGASDGIFKGCFGALDGLAIRIKRPTKTASLRDPGAYYCRKGFHALNVQAICDSDKKILWMSSSHQGSCHDSTAWSSTMLYKALQVRSEWLYARDWFIVGDSAYNMESFLLVPYDRPDVRRATGQKEDAYNFYHSNCRIRIECTFGELIMRWGIFWRKLQMDIGAVGLIVEAASLLHNFIIDERLAKEAANDIDYFSSFDYNTLRSENQIDEELPVAMVSSNTAPKPPGRPTLVDTISKEKGRNRRQLITWDLDRNGMTRPRQHGFKYNAYGMIYME